MIIQANDILRLLIDKKSEKFICIPECKTGKSYGSRYKIMDLWCMAKSWAQPKVIAYEIKVNRQDFLRDAKWKDYLGYCNEFYFVAPPGFISPDELPEEAGLIQCSTNCKMLYTKKKAPERSVAIPESIYRYILMWRAKIGTEHRFSDDSVSYWKHWLEDKKEKKDLGYNVSKRIRQIYETDVIKVREENKELRFENEVLQDVKRILKKLNFDPRKHWDREGRLTRKVKDELHENVALSIKQAVKTLDETLKILERGIK